MTECDKCLLSQEQAQRATKSEKSYEQASWGWQKTMRAKKDDVTKKRSLEQHEN